jgi:hypothetical protein
VNGNPAQEIDRFHGAPLRAIHSRKTAPLQRLPEHG